MICTALENSVYDLSQGGYACLKTLIEQERNAPMSGAFPPHARWGDFLKVHSSIWQIELRVSLA